MIHKNLSQIKLVAISYAQEHDCNYNIIISNHYKGVFHPAQSTYEFVRDSYFEKERPNDVLLYRTDDLIKGYPRALYDQFDPIFIYIRDESTAFIISADPIGKPKPGEESWPISEISKIRGVAEVTKLIKDSLFPAESKTHDPEMPLEPMKDDDRLDSEHFENIIKKHGENYSREKDYERVFQQQHEEK